MKKLTQLKIYSGKSYSDHGLFNLTIDSDFTAEVLRQIDQEFVLDWFLPHDGPTFQIGEYVQVYIIIFIDFARKKRSEN